MALPADQQLKPTLLTRRSSLLILHARELVSIDDYDMMVG